MAEQFTHISLWGQDHYSTLLYMETCAVDKNGRVDNDKMRVSPSAHPELYRHRERREYPTKLKGGRTLEGHDDYSCMKDMNLMGLLHFNLKGQSCTVKLTDKGFNLASLVRRWRARGGRLAEFVAPDMESLVVGELIHDDVVGSYEYKLFAITAGDFVPEIYIFSLRHEDEDKFAPFHLEGIENDRKTAIETAKYEADVWAASE